MRPSARNPLPFLVPLGAAIALLCVLHYFAPLQFEPVLVYLGLVTALAGLLCLVKPLRWLAIPTRRAAVLVAGAGVVLILAGLNWPAHRTQVGNRSCRLDDFLPEYDFYERHEQRVHATPERTMAVLKDVTFADIGVVDTLMRIRLAAAGRFRVKSAPGKVRVLEALSRPGSGFLPLDENGREVVMGMAGRPWSSAPQPRPRNSEEWMEFQREQSVKIAFNLAVYDEGGGWSRVVTETRIRATDDAARKTMARYWRVIYPGTGIIRRMWLNAVRTRAESV